MEKRKIKLRNVLQHCLLTEDITYVGSIKLFTPISQYWSCYKAPLIASRAKSLATASRKPYFIYHLALITKEIVSAC